MPAVARQGLRVATHELHHADERSQQHRGQGRGHVALLAIGRLALQGASDREGHHQVATDETAEVSACGDERHQQIDHDLQQDHGDEELAGNPPPGRQALGLVELEPQGSADQARHDSGGAEHFVVTGDRAASHCPEAPAHHHQESADRSQGPFHHETEGQETENVDDEMERDQRKAVQQVGGGDPPPLPRTHQVGNEERRLHGEGIDELQDEDGETQADQQRGRHPPMRIQRPLRHLVHSHELIGTPRLFSEPPAERLNELIRVLVTNEVTSPDHERRLPTGEPDPPVRRLDVGQVGIRQQRSLEPPPAQPEPQTTIDEGKETPRRVEFPPRFDFRSRLHCAKVA